MKRILPTVLALVILLCGFMPQTQMPTQNAAVQELLTNTAKTTQTVSDETFAPKPLSPKVLDYNPYISGSEANLHNDWYNTDTTDAVLPIGIFPEVNVALETEAPNASPAIFYDKYNNAVVPLLNGIAIRDISSDTVKTLGSFIPGKNDTQKYSIQTSYSFVDADNHIVCPTSHNHVIIFRVTDENGKPLSVFEKLLDIDVKAVAEKALGKELEQNLLSIVYDYEGNLWFATGGFRIYPERKQTGTFGYISRAAIDAILAGKSAELSKEVFVYETEAGEGAENGIASSRNGTVILTNLACYMLRANNGVEVVWRTPYESVGAKTGKKGDATTGGGLAWGSGCSPSLSCELVFFTDNLDPVNLIALDIKTGKKAASMPIIDELPENMPVSVENSAIVYDNGIGTVSTIVCNWFGASNPNLSKPNSDSSIQTFENVYDMNWIQKGNIMIMPGIERIDTIKTATGYEMKSIWCRKDIRDTSMFKLSTATGYLYGYIQDMSSGMWQYIILDFDTGETVLTMDVSSQYGYNNMATGMFAGADGNALYSPTGCRKLLRLQDRFAYLSDNSSRKLDLDLTSRTVISAQQFMVDGGKGTPATWLHTVTVDNAKPKFTIALRVKGLSGKADSLSLYAYNTNGRLEQIPDEQWTLKNAKAELDPAKIYEIYVQVDDGGTFDLNADKSKVTLSALATYAPDTEYIYKKITHQEKDVMTTDGIVDYIGNGKMAENLENGQGDRGQNYTWGSIGYGDYMYIGTCYGAWMTTLNLMKNMFGHNYDPAVMKEALDTYYREHIYTGESDGVDALGILVKLNVKTGEAKILMSMDRTKQNTIFRNAVEFKNKLYFCGVVNGIPCVYQVDPKTDKCKQVYAGMTQEEYVASYKKGISAGIRGICVCDGRLLISNITSTGAVICEAENPTGQDSFKVIATDKDLCDYPAYHYCDSIYGGSIFDMTQFGNSLYVSICTGTPKNATDENTMQSFALVRGDRQSNGKWKWTSVVGDQSKDNAKYTFGIDPERTRSGAANLMVFGDYLYIGEYNDEEIAVERMLFDNDFTFMNMNFEQSVNLYRMNKDEEIELVVGNADEMFPRGSLSGLDSGFGHNENQYIWKMVVYDGKLYVGTYDASSFLIPLDEYMNGKDTTEAWKRAVDGYVKKLCKNYTGVPQSAYTCAEYLDKAVFGFDLYVTEDGEHFTKITDDGFGDPYNHGCRAFGITNEGLFVGTANPFYGAQVWKLSEE